MEFSFVIPRIFLCWKSSFNSVRKVILAKRSCSSWLILLVGGTVAPILVWVAWRVIVMESGSESLVQSNNHPAMENNLVSDSRITAGEAKSVSGLQGITNEKQVGTRITGSYVTEAYRDGKFEPKPKEFHAVDNEHLGLPKTQMHDDAEEITGETEMGFAPYYSLGKPLKDWDAQRQVWLDGHPRIKNYTENGRPRMFLVTGSEPGPCKNPVADHLLLRSFKNKLDYCRIHGIEMFYNVALLDPAMDRFWAKLPLVRAAMVSHPEAEWIWWIDSDAVVTDMYFELPLDKYRDYNLVVHGWENLVFVNRSWVSLNAGSFLVRNCKWTMHFLERWASMGPLGPIRDASGKIQADFLPDRPQDWPGDDQSALIYLLVKEKKLWADKIFIENSYNLNGYWLDIVDSFKEIEERYQRLARYENPAQRNAERQEKLAQKYANLREAKLLNASSLERRPFVTHFTGCQFCTGRHNEQYHGDVCVKEIERALNFADNQVLLSYGFRHVSLEKSEVEPLD